MRAGGLERLSGAGCLVWLVLWVSGCSGGGSGGSSSLQSDGGAASSGGASGGGGTVVVPGVTDDGGVVTYGQPYTGGQYNLGPVDYAESQYHNACAPSTKYPAEVQTAEGNLLAGLWSGIALWDGIPNVAGFCDACIWVTTAKGASAMLRVVTYGSTSTNSIDTSTGAYQDLNMMEYPRSMTWQFAKCPDTGAMMYEFQTGSSQYWTSLWVRNARVPLMKVEVESANHSSWTELSRGTDGTLTDSSGFGMGMFSIRSTGVDGQQVVDTFPWPSTGIAGAFLTGQGNFE
jgi:hypothetical protein